MSLIDSGQGRFRYPATTQMIVATTLGVHVRLNIPQALPARQLSHEQRQELVPAADFAQSLANMMRIGQLLEFMSRHELEEL